MAQPLIRVIGSASHREAQVEFSFSPQFSFGWTLSKVAVNFVSKCMICEKFYFLGRDTV
jgi:hypothetical protein